MKNLKKQMCLLIVAMMLLPFLGFSTASADVTELSSGSTVENKLLSVSYEFPKGVRWTKSFGDMVKAAKGNDGTECYGFAKLVVYKVFGKDSKTKGYRDWGNVSLSGLVGMEIVENKKLNKGYSEKDLAALLKKAKPGDVIQCTGGAKKSDGKYEEHCCLHTMIVFSVDAANEKIQIYDCNWDNNCGIQMRNYTFSDLYSHVTKRGNLAILRATNYDSVNQETFISLEKVKGLGKGCSLVLEPKISPKNAVCPQMIYTVDDASIATVDSAGKVVGKKEGKTIVHVKSSDGKYSFDCEIHVLEVAKPASIKISEGKGKVTVEWGKASKAQKYALYKQVGDGNWTKVNTFDSEKPRSYTDKSVKPGTRYAYRVKAGVDFEYSVKDCKGKAKATAWSAYEKAVIWLPSTSPNNVSVSAGTGEITVKWNAVNGAQKYALLRMEGDNNWIILNTELTETSFVDKTAVAGKTYQYGVRVYSNGWSAPMISPEVKAK